MTTYLFRRAFITATAERALKTASQTAIATIGTTAVIHEVDWLIVGSATALATVLSVLTSIASGANDGQPSLAQERLDRN